MVTIRSRSLGLGLLLIFLCASINAAPASVSPAKALEKTDSEKSFDDALCNTTDTEVDCNQTEYSEYMKCVEEKRALRKKRQANCPQSDAPHEEASNSTASALDSNAVLSECQFTYQKCVAGCQTDASCIKGCPSCGDSSSALYSVTCPGEFHDCVANCDEGHNCETTCKSLCPGSFKPLGYETVIFEGQNGQQFERVQVPIGIPHNITTIIKLNNIINMTNHIHMPTNINNTNLNTIQLYSNSTEEGGEFGLGQTKDGSCCFAVQPKSCRTSTDGLRCRHRRHKTCGSQCTSRIIHAQKRTSCNRRGKCNARVNYVPEPRPKCHYAPQWPYVSCGGHAQPRKCDGCYDHYQEQMGGYYYQQPSVPRRCMACYDDGFDQGPLYRQGPYYRPSFYHEPPCYLTGTCYPYGYGMYPAAPPPPPPPMYPQGPPPQFETEDDFNVHDETDLGGDGFPGEDEDMEGQPIEDFNEEEWEQVVKKCKVVNLDDNTVVVNNCTETEVGENPYAATKVSEGEDGETNVGGGERTVVQRRHRNGQGNSEASRMAPPHPPPAYYQYQPYSYYYAPPPPPPVSYGGYGSYGGYYAAPQVAYDSVPPRRNSSRPASYPEYYDNYGVDEEAAEDLLGHDTQEKDLLDKGFEKVEEK